MKEIKKIAEGASYTAVNIGLLSEIAEHAFIHPRTKQTVSGKVFLKEATKSTGTEISFQVLKPQTELSYFHIHDENEETYIVLSGSGTYQVDGTCFPISQGSIIRVSPEGKRGFCNTSDEEMVLIVVQSKERSLNKYTGGDGSRVDFEPKWR